MKVKVSKVVEIYNLLNAAKLTKLETADKFSVIKTVQAMKPTATAF